MPKKTISITEARGKIFKIADDVQLPDSHYILTENGVPKAVILSAEEFESMQETIETLIDIPDLYEDIKRVEKDIETGAYKNYITLEEVLKKDKHVVSHPLRRKGKQRA